MMKLTKPIKGIIIMVFTLLFALGIVIKKVMPTLELKDLIEQNQSSLLKDEAQLVNPVLDSVNADEISNSLETVQTYILKSLESEPNLEIISISSQIDEESDEELVVSISGDQKSLLKWFRKFDAEFRLAKRNSVILKKEKKRLTLIMNFSLIILD